VNMYTNTPVNAVWLVVVFSIVLNMIGIASTQTMVAIFNITAPALDISYATVILARNIYASRIEFRSGPYVLGWMQKPLNAITVVWVFFISVVLLFPTVRPVTAINFNYAVVVAAVIALFSFGWWWAGARKCVYPHVLISLCIMPLFLLHSNYFCPFCCLCDWRSISRA
jgi:hypothetical protein